MMKLLPLTANYNIGSFDCGDADLNHFLMEDAIPAQQLRIANTFILDVDGHTAAYFCLLNDKVSKDEVIGSRWKKLKAGFPKGKQFRSYPTVKIGRFAVSLDFRGRQIGTDLLQKIKLMLSKQRAHSAFRYITVDAYLSAVSFYEKNGFVHLTKRDEDEHTRLMFYDMMEVE